MYGIEVVPNAIAWVEPSPELCIRLSNAVLFKHPKKKNQRVVVQICKEGDGAAMPAIAVLTPDMDCVPLNILVNTRIGLRLSGNSGKGAVVHVTGDKFTPTEELFGDSEHFLPGFIDDNVMHEDGAMQEDSDSDSDGYDDSADDVAMELKELNDSLSGPSSKGTVDKAASASNGKKASDISKAETSLTKTKNEARPLANVPKKGSKSLEVVTLKSGLRYQNLLVGCGKAVVKGHFVALHYSLRLENGKEVDSTDRKRPFKFRLGIGECIKGFDVGIIGMREGGQRHLIVPPDLGYGDQALPDIPPGSTLYFDVSVVRAF